MVLSDLQGRPSAREEGREAAEEGLKGLTGWPRANERVEISFSSMHLCFLHFRERFIGEVFILFFYLLLHSILSTFSFGGGGGGGRLAGPILTREVGILYSEYYFFPTGSCGW